VARLPLFSLVLLGPPFGRGGADATGDRRGAGEGLDEPGGRVCSSRDRRQVTGDKSADLETEREANEAGGMECGPYWAELPHRVRAGNNNTSTQSTVTGDGD
jgi:hypothetical protein